MPTVRSVMSVVRSVMSTMARCFSGAASLRRRAATAMAELPMFGDDTFTISLSGKALFLAPSHQKLSPQTRNF
jgi:hypothetical protein